MDGMISDLRYALRQFAVAPGIHLAAVVILTCALGLTLSVYSVVKSAVLEPLPYPGAERMFGLWERSSTQSDAGPTRVAPPVFLAWRASSVFEEVAAFSGASYVVLGAGEPMRVNGLAASASLFSLLGATFQIGRGFNADEDRVGAAGVAVLSDRLWRSRFGARPDVLNERVLLDGDPYIVVGVTGRDLEVPGEQPELFVPLMPTLAGVETVAGAKYLSAVGRIRPALSAEAATIQLSSISSTIPDNQGWEASLVPLRDQVSGDMKSGLLMLLAAVIGVLLIACANAANLLLARTPDRARELAIRTALGASRPRILRLIMTDAVVLAVLSGVLGITLAAWATDVLVAMSPDILPRRDAIEMDGSVLLFSAILLSACALGIGSIPALVAARPDLAGTLKEVSRTATTGRGRALLRRALLVSEVALMALLLTGASLLIRSFNRIISTNPGFRPEQVIAFDLSLPANKYAGGSDWMRFSDALLERANGILGVTAAAVTTNLPISGRIMTAPLAVENLQLSAGQVPPRAHAASVTPGYLAALQVPLKRGRWFDSRDVRGALPVAVINESLARTLFANQDPIGKKARTFFGPPIMKEIVGVVGDVHQTKLTEAPPAVFYTPFAQDPRSFMTVVARSERGITAVTRDLMAALRQIDPDQPITRSESMSDLIAASVATPRFLATLLAVFAALSFALALAGIYAVMAANVAERRRELGVRIALGARPADLARLIGGDAVRLAVIGLAIGSLSALAIARALRALLFGVQPGDAVSYAIVASLVLAVAMVGSTLPLRRALRIDPAEVIRD